MMDQRRATILRAVVQEYIETAQPVGSGHVARLPEVRVSPATVRHDMVVLEQEGYLRQPHTSAGRVPTDKGYRMFVDNLVEPGPLQAIQRQQVSTFFAKAHGALEEMLQDTTRLLSGLTDYAAVITAAPVDDTTVRSVQLVGLGGRTALVVVVLSNGVVTKAAFEMGDDVGDEHLAAATVHLSRWLMGLSSSALPPVPPSGDPVVDLACARAVAALDEAGHEHDASPMFVGGASRMAAAFDAVDSVRRVLGILEQQYVMVGLLRDIVERGLTVAIGTEHGVEPLAECSVVVAPYTVEGETAGAIGVLGPTRMHYPQALAAVAVVSQRLSERLSTN
ncbi:MAG: heat-inducible transcriptional repressor HrcA [Actinobacteria bacterium]|nr:heat-inducible transcriptional repressor HrcA [Actinomycetota bacterium]MBW3641899.1 heat-inducible transcriptional repressor HrcA [Actinomycetota bacterium]